MKFVTYNKQKISKLSLGTVQFGLDYGIANSEGKPSQNCINEIVNHIYEHNINCFDTAQDYGNSEEVLGKSLVDKSDIVIVSKLKSELFEENLDKNISKTLDNLQQKTIFGLLLHDSQLLYRWSQKHSFSVQQLLDDKKIDYFGVSIYSNKDFELAINNDNIQIIQIPFNLFDQRAVTQRWLKRAKEANKLIFIRSIFLQGLFFMNKDELKGNLAKAKPYLERLKELEHKFNLSTAELAMAYVESVAKESVLLFGCDSLAQAKENISSYKQLPILKQESLDELKELFSTIPEEITNPTLWRLS